MDALLCAALQEVAVEGSQGCSIPKLWGLLQNVPSGPATIANIRSKQILWQNLINVPGMILLGPNSVAVDTMDSRFQSVEEAEKLRLQIVAPEALRDSALGMYDLKVCDARLSKEQRCALEYIARSRSTGVTQSQLAKEFNTPGNKMFYIVKMLEVRGLVVRQATLVRTVDGTSEGSKHVPIVATNLLHLTRYAKDRTLSSHQRFEILNPCKVSAQNEWNTLREDTQDEAQGTGGTQREFIIKDDLPAMQAVCQKLEETEGKVLVVSDLKTTLGYRMAVGHRTWRRLVKRLKDAGLVEILNAQIDEKVRSCIRLVKSFDASAFKTANEETENDPPLKCAKRGQVTGLVTELPIDQQIYDLVDQSGSDGVQMIEVFNYFGLQNKRNYFRVSTVLERNLLVSEAENHKRSTVYRLKTAKNANGIARPSTVTSGAESISACYDLVVPPRSSELNEECEEIVQPQSSGLDNERASLSLEKETALPAAQSRVNGSARKALQQARMLKGKNKQLAVIEVGNEQHPEKDIKVLALPAIDLVPSNRNAIIASSSDGVIPSNDLNLKKQTLQAESPGLPPSVTFIPREFTGKESHLNSNNSLSTTRAQREKRILEKLQAEKFVLRVELHRWLEEVENRKNIAMDRKTLSRILHGLQSDGHCKCVMLSMPGLTNCGRQRTSEVVLLPSLAVDADLLSKVHDLVRKFDMVSRGQGVSRVKAKDSIPVLTGVPRMCTAHVKRIVKFDRSSGSGLSMQGNGFIPAKMVRVRMLHYFLWGYVNSLPDDVGLRPPGTGTSGDMVGSCKIFGLANALQTMPVELFLQTIGSLHKIENLTEWCKQGQRLCDLPRDDFVMLLDANATGRLSWLVDVLRRLKLVRLVMGCGPAVQVDQEALGRTSLSAVLTYAMEREPYMEEPAPHPLPSLSLDTYDVSPRARHEFCIVNKDGLDAYWQNLEYFYSGAQPVIARHAFPGTNVPELFGLRSWASLKIMSVEQRTELLKRVGDGGIGKRRPWHECVTIAKELNLSLQQVLRVSYEKNRVYRLQTLQKGVQTSRKRSTASGDLGEPPHVKAYKKQQRQHGGSGKETVPDGAQADAAANGEDKQVHQEDDDGDDDEDESLGIGGPQMSDFSFVSSVRPSRLRSMRFAWSEELDRLLIAAYSRQRAQLGARFHRVEWDLMENLPAPPQACRRRMAQLRLDLGVRKAITSLCSLLTLRYVNCNQATTGEVHLCTPGPAAPSVGETQMLTSDCETNLIQRQLEPHTVSQFSLEPGFDEGLSNIYFVQERDWDDFKEPFLAAALDEVMRCRAVVKATASVRSNTSRTKLSQGHNHEKVPFGDSTAGSSPSVKPGSCKMIRNIATVAAAGALSWITAKSMNHSISAICRGGTPVDEETVHNITGPMHGRSLTVAGPTRRVRKRDWGSLQSSPRLQEITSEQLVRTSVAVANAVELVKLVLLYSVEDIQLPGTLVEAVQRFKETEVFTALKYLRDGGFLVTGQAGQAVVLSQKFFHDCSASRFPVGTGDDCHTAEQWVRTHMKEIEQNWVPVPPEQKPGQLSHLLALVSSDEFSLTPTLPGKDLGEMEEKETYKQRPSSYDQSGHVRNVKSRNMSSCPQWLTTLRKERGFPGIEVSMICSNRSLATVLDTFGRRLDHISDLPLELDNVEVLMDGNEIVPLLTAGTSPVQGLDDDSHVSTIGQDLIATESVLAELDALPDLLHGGHDLNSICRHGKQGLLSGSHTSSRGTSTDPRKSNLDDCIQHWCSNSTVEVSRLPSLKSELLEATYLTVKQSGEEGLSLENLGEGLQSSGIHSKQEFNDYVQALESFSLVKRVNAYDHVRIVETSQSARFYLHISHKVGWESEQNYCAGGNRDFTMYSSSASGGYVKSSGAVGIETRFDLKLASISSSETSSSHHMIGMATTTPTIIAKSGDHRVISLRPDEDVDSNTEYFAIVPWVNPDGTINKSLLKGLTRRVMGIIALHPGITEDTLQKQMNVLNPQSLRQLTQILELEGHLLARSLRGPEVSPPRLLQHLVGRENYDKTCLRHYFINPVSGESL